MKFSLPCYNLIFGLVLCGCSALPTAEDPPLVENLPTIQSLIDSLTSAGSQVIKWSQSDSVVTYTIASNIDWSEEFKAFERDNVNKLRFAEAYRIQDETSDGIRTVTFTALSEAQEIQKMAYTISRGRLIGLSITKDRSNLFSTSKQIFSFERNQYSLSIDQRIPWFFSNQQYAHAEIVPPGDIWRAQFFLTDVQLPVQCVIQKDQILVKNDEEWVTYKRDMSSLDSVVYHSIHFNTYFKVATNSDSVMAGRWVNAKNETELSIPVKFTKNIRHRFAVKKQPRQVLKDRYMLLMNNARLDKNDTAILVLSQNNHQVTGSVLTETGDYRWLDGVIRNDSLLLSSMDGTHAYMVHAAINENGLDGVFYSGMTWKQKIIAVPDSTFALRNAEIITYIKSGEKFTFSFPDSSGIKISLGDPAFKNKVVVVSIMGTWCSNCMDEAMFLKEVQARYPSEELAMVGLDYELVRDSARAWYNIKKHIAGFNLSYPVLLAAVGTNKEVAAASLPALNGIFSYPTLVVLDKSHEVVRIHTGFSGPATGKPYLEFKSEYFNLLDQLVQQ